MDVVDKCRCNAMALISWWPSNPKVTLFFDSEYQQTSPVSVVPVNGGINDFFSALGVVSNFNDFDVNGISVGVPTSPGTTYIMAIPEVVILANGTSSPAYRFETSFLTPSQLAAQFPTGTYVVAGRGLYAGPDHRAFAHFSQGRAILASEPVRRQLLADQLHCRV